MLGILIDAIALIVILHFVDRDESPDFPKMLLAAVIMAALNFGIGMVAAPLGLLALVPMILVDGLFLGWWCEMTWRRAVLAVSILFVVKIAYTLAFVSMTG